VVWYDARPSSTPARQLTADNSPAAAEYESCEQASAAAAARADRLRH